MKYFQSVVRDLFIIGRFRWSTIPELLKNITLPFGVIVEFNL